MPNFDCIEKPLSRLFNVYGRFVTKNPYLFIVFPVLISGFFSLGFLTLEPITDAIYLFTPVGAPSKVERQIIHDLWPLTNGSYIPGRAVTQSREVQLTIRAKDDGNVLLKPYSEAIHRLDQFIQNRIRIIHDGRKYKYADLCLQWRNEGCPGAKHIQAISEFYQKGYNITYPTLKIGSFSGYIGSSLGGVAVGRDKSNRLVLASAKAWLLVYHLRFYPSDISYISGLWEKSFEAAMKEYKDPYLDITFFHSQSLAEELKRNADSLIPRFAFAFSILMAFSVLCSMATVSGTVYVDWVLSKPIVAVLGVCNAGMGIGTSIGLLSMAGFPYNDIVGVMPFLIVAVGVDNMFLMVAALRRTNRLHPPDIRLGECMSDAAISMFITSLTDAFSFGVGTITSIPAVQIFCVYTCGAMIVTFLYQITFFTAILGLFTRWESENRHCVFFQETISANDREYSSIFEKIFWLGSRADKKPQKESAASYFFQNWFAPILMQPVVKILTLVWYIVYVIFAIHGCLQIKEGLEPVNLLVEDSYAVPHYHVLENYFWQYGAVVQ
uniref:SSD domain-containing protein n=1 Tax=Panagrolaimus sp. JU765 TaxID=591449 RepID=A0AC34QKR6_9BILA